MSRNKILFQLTGSIACFKACQLLSKLVQNGFEVDVVATRAALQFVGEATLEGLTGRRIHTETFAAGSYMDHIHLIRWADLVLLCPATANSINKLASGIGDDLVSTLFLAHDFEKPYLIAPAMNSKMLAHPATSDSLRRLQDWGVEVLTSGQGALACGEVGDGRLLEPDDIFRQVILRLEDPKPTKSLKKSLKILVTSGGTREPIDGVRSITNFSTGKTGSAIATKLSADGHEVTLARARGAEHAHHARTREIEFSSFSDLEKLLQSELSTKNYDAVIHAAAVGDFSLSTIEANGKPVSAGEGKIESDADELVLRLKKNPKLIDELRSMSLNPAIQIVAFKLTNTGVSEEREKAIAKLAHHAMPDFIVHNDLSEISATSHLTRIFASRDPSQLREIATAPTKLETAQTLEQLLMRGAHL